MARDFAWRDLLILPRFRDQQLFLDNTLELAYQPGLLASVILSLLSPASGFCTTIHSPLEDQDKPDVHLVGQLHYTSSRATAHLAYLAPRSQVTHPGMGQLLSHLCKQAGTRGAFQVLAEIGRDSDLEDLFFQCGFRPYAEQSIWILPRNLPRDLPSRVWFPIRGEHAGKLVSIYQRAVPSSVRHIEPPPRIKEVQGLIACEGDHPLGYAQAHFGPSAVLVDVLFDPAAEDLGRHLAAINHQLPYHNSRKIFFRVRGYQKRLSTALESMGAVSDRRQVAVVKRLTAQYHAQQKIGFRTFEKQPDTSPISQAEVD